MPNIGLLSSAIISLRSAQSDHREEDPTLSKISELAIGLIGLSEYFIEAHEHYYEIRSENEEKNIHGKILNLQDDISKLSETLNNKTQSITNDLLYINDKINYLCGEIDSIKNTWKMKF